MTIEELQKQLNELPENKSKRIIEFLLHTEFKDLKIKLDKKVKEKLINPLRSENKKYITFLYKNYNDIPKETINLLNQSLQTIKNTHYLLKHNYLVDANTLLRSCFENIIMAMMINFDEDVYEEFKILGLKDEERKSTKLSKLRNEFKKKLKCINPFLFNDISNRKIGNLLQDFYDKLCLYSHSTLIVNEMIEIGLNNDERLFSFAIKMNVYFIEIILHSCLKYLAKDDSCSIDYNYIILGTYSLLLTIDKEKCSPNYLKKYNDLLYVDINEKFINENKKGLEEIQNMSNEIKEFINENPIAVVNFIVKLIDK